MALSNDQLSLLFRAKGNTDDAKQAFSSLKSSVDKDVSSIESKINSSGQKISGNIGSIVGNIGDLVTGLGKTLSVSLTVPITAAAYAIGNFGLDVNELKNQLTAFEGSSSAAEVRLKSLRALVDANAGATREMAYGVYALLKPLEVLSDETIDKTIVALGKAKLGFKNLIPNDFAYNLTQIFGQNFEEQDIKQAIGQIPKFKDYLLKAFGTSDNETLRAMKESGKITMDSFFEGISEAIENDQALAGLEEPTRLRMQKFFERAFEAVEPLANQIVALIDKILAFLTPLIEQLGSYFKTLSPAMQQAAIIIAGIAAALGPVLIAVGSLISFFAPLISAIVTAGGVTAALSGAIAAAVPVISALGPAILAIIGIIAALGVAVAAVYAVWQTNFGGMRDFSIAAFEKIKEIIEAAYKFIYDVTVSIMGAVVTWWNENYEQIRETAETVSDAVKSIIQGFLDAVSSFWNAHGESILNYVSVYWDTIKNIFAGVLEQIGNLLRLALEVINGDWEKAWQTFLEIIKDGTKLAVTIWKGLNDTIAALLKALIPIIVEYGVKIQTTLETWFLKAVTGAVIIWATLPERLIRLVPQMLRAGYQIGTAIVQGIKDAFTQNPIIIPGSQQSLADLRQSDDTNFAPSGGYGQIIEPKAQTPEVDAKAAEKARKEREKAYQKELDLQAKYQSVLLKQEKENLETNLKANEDDLEKRRITQQEFQEWSLRDLNAYESNVRAIMGNLFAIEQKGKSGTELATLKKEAELALIELENNVAEKRKAIEKNYTQAVEKENKERLSDYEASLRRAQSFNDAYIKQQKAKIEREYASEILTEEEKNQKLYKLELDSLEAKKSLLEEYAKKVEEGSEKELDLRQEIKNLEIEIGIIKADNAAQSIINAEKEKEFWEEINKGTSTASDPEATPGKPLLNFFEAFAQGVVGFLENIALVRDEANNLQFSMSAVFTSLKDLALDAFGAIAQGFGQMVANWVLYGSQGESSLRKLTATILANVAQTATTYAIMCLAAAALSSTIFGAALLGGTPAQFLAAAALFGAVAVGTALLGRAVAGDSFKNRNDYSNAYAGNDRARGINNSASSNDTRTITEGRIQRQDQGSGSQGNLAAKIQIGFDKGLIVRTIEENINNRGSLYGLVVRTAENG